MFANIRADSRTENVAIILTVWELPSSEPCWVLNLAEKKWKGSFLARMFHPVPGPDKNKVSLLAFCRLLYFCFIEICRLQLSYRMFHLITVDVWFYAKPVFAWISEKRRKPTGSLGPAVNLFDNRLNVENSTVTDSCDGTLFGLSYFEMSFNKDR